MAHLGNNHIETYNNVAPGQSFQALCFIQSKGSGNVTENWKQYDIIPWVPQSRLQVRQQKEPMKTHT